MWLNASYICFNFLPAAPVFGFQTFQRTLLASNMLRWGHGYASHVIFTHRAYSHVTEQGFSLEMKVLSPILSLLQCEWNGIGEWKGVNLPGLEPAIFALSGSMLQLTIWSSTACPGQSYWMQGRRQFCESGGAVMQVWSVRKRLCTRGTHFSFTIKNFIAIKWEHTNVLTGPLLKGCI